MRGVILTLKEIPKIHIDVEGILPKTIKNKRKNEIEDLKILYGKEIVKLGDFFDVEKTSENTLIFCGNLERVKRIGFRMDEGIIKIEGNAGMYVGAFMEGGKIIAHGNVGSFSGLNMKGGEIIIEKNAGDYLGAAYRGNWKGMSGGNILVRGNGGRETGAYMSGGKIVIRGKCGTFTGVGMKGGVIQTTRASFGLGASMKKGYIIVEEEIEDLLPGFIYEGEVKNPEIEGEKLKGKYLIYSGDHAERGTNGRILVKCRT